MSIFHLRVNFVDDSFVSRTTWCILWQERGRRSQPDGRRCRAAGHCKRNQRRHLKSRRFSARRWRGKFSKASFCCLCCRVHFWKCHCVGVSSIFITVMVLKIKRSSVAETQRDTVYRLKICFHVLILYDNCSREIVDTFCSSNGRVL